MKRMILLTLTLLLALLPVGALADVVPYTADFYVADYAEVLSDEVEGLIVLNNDRLDEACGAQIVVVTINSTGGAEIENYAYTLFNEWGIGDKAKNNGLLILLAVQDGSYWLMPGKGLQDYLNAGDLDEMANEYFIPQAQVGNFEEGIRQLFAACFDKMSIAYNAGVSIDESLYYSWLQSAPDAADGAKFVSEPVREMPVTSEPDPVIPEAEDPVSRPSEPRRGGDGVSMLAIVCIAAIVIVVIVRSRRTVRSRPGQYRAAPPPRRPVAPPPPRPPMGGYVRPTSRPAPRPAPRSPMGGGMGSRPTGGYNRPASPSRPTGGRTGGGVTRGGGSGGSFSRPASRTVSRPSSSRPSGGFGGGRSGGGGMTRGGGSGGSFRGGR